MSPAPEAQRLAWVEKVGGCGGQEGEEVKEKETEWIM